MTYTVSMTPLGRWQVKRSDGMIMAVLGTWLAASAYAQEKCYAERS